MPGIRIAVLTGILPGVLIASEPGAQSFPARTVRYATGGSGTSNHIATEAIRVAAGIDMADVPYKGSSQAAQDVLPGRIPLLATVLVEAIPFIQSGRLKVIAATSPRRAPSLPHVPTVVHVSLVPMLER